MSCVAYHPTPKALSAQAPIQIFPPSFWPIRPRFFESQTLDRTPNSIHHTPYIIHHTPYTIYNAPCTIHYTPYSIHQRFQALHPKLQTRIPAELLESPDGLDDWVSGACETLLGETVTLGNPKPCPLSLNLTPLARHPRTTLNFGP